MQIDIERLIHSTKTAIACIIGLFLARFIGLTNDQWVVITIVVVMCAQIYVGSVLSRAYLRLLGTFMGCLFASITLLTLGHTIPATVLVIALSSFAFSFIATGKENLTYTGTLGAVTTIIIMLTPEATISTAIERVLEISVGIIIATLVSQFVLPIHGRDHLRRAQAVTIKSLREFYIATMIARSIDTLEQYQDLDESIAKSLFQQRALAKNSVKEPFGKPFDTGHFMQTLYAERDILRSIFYLHQALTHMDESKITLSKLATLHSFNESILQALNTIAIAIPATTPIKDRIKLPPLSALKQDFLAHLEKPSRDDEIYVDSLIFSAEILTNSVAKLAVFYDFALEV